MRTLSERPLPPRPRVDSGATSTVSLLHGLLQADAELTRWHADGFTHWAHGHAQRVRVEGPLGVDGAPTYWMSFETEVLRGLPAPGALSSAVVGNLNWDECLFTIVEDGGRLVYRARTWFRPRTADHRARELVGRALLANALARSGSERLARWLRDRLPEAGGVEPARSGEARGGPRQGSGGAPGSADTVSAQAQGPSSVDVRPELEALAKDCGETGHRVRYREQDDALYVGGSEAGEAFDLTVRLVDRHPIFGAGMFTLLALPLEGDDPTTSVSSLAARLNRAEWTARARLNSTGAWVVRTSGLLARQAPAYVQFVPHTHLNGSSVRVSFADMLARVRWYSEAIEGGGRR